jgi:hypothetical protein
MEGGNGRSLQGFYLLPVSRSPTDKASLLNNDADSDASDAARRVLGVFIPRQPFCPRLRQSSFGWI